MTNYSHRDKTEEWDFAHTERAMHDQGFTGLVALVQYREHGKLYWRNMAAFDSLTQAERYCQQCSDSSVFEYRFIAYEA